MHSVPGDNNINKTHYTPFMVPPPQVLLLRASSWAAQREAAKGWPWRPQPPLPALV